VGQARRAVGDAGDGQEGVGAYVERPGSLERGPEATMDEGAEPLQRDAAPAA
jgi:hypothetical protein